jgi:protein-tyrosine phosphatase
MNCEFDYNWILNDVAIGNIKAGSNFPHLKKENISAIVCAIPTLPYPVEHYSSNGFSLFHIPIDDSPEVDIGKWFNDVSDFIMVNRLMNRKILVHCHAGMSRSVALTCAFLMNLFGCDDVKALYWIRDKRPCINVNPGFLRQLATYGKKYK